MSPTAARRSKKKKSAVPSTTPRPFVAHHLAPRHEVLSEEESKRVLAELNTAPERLPRILIGDPGLQTDSTFVARRDAGELLVGRLVRIHRPSATAGEAIAYRLIVPTVGSD
jgi:DNA-directed RNA polymerase subunit H